MPRSRRRSSRTVVWADLPLAFATNPPGPDAYGHLIANVLPVLRETRSG